MKSLIRLNIVLTAQNSFNFFEEIESFRLEEGDVKEIKDNVSKWFAKFNEGDSFFSLGEKYSLFTSDKLYPLNQFRNLIEDDLDEVAKNSVEVIFKKRKNTLQDVSFFLLDEEISDIDYIHLNELKNENSVSSYILPIYILTEHCNRKLFTEALVNIKNSNNLIKFKQSLFFENLINVVVSNRFHTMSRLITANMYESQEQAYHEAFLTQRCFKNALLNI